MTPFANCLQQLTRQLLEDASGIGFAPTMIEQRPNLFENLRPFPPVRSARLPDLRPLQAPANCGND